MKKLMFLPLIAMMMVACASNVEMASEEAGFQEVPIPQSFVAHVVVETQDHLSPTFNMPIPSTTQYWETDADGEWVPKMELINDILMESVEIPSVHESEPVTGKYALLTPIQKNDNQPVVDYFGTQNAWDRFVTKCWIQNVDPSNNSGVLIADGSYCYNGNTFCYGSVDGTYIFFLSCLWGY